MKYRILAHPESSECYLYGDEWDDIDEAVRAAMSVLGSDFWVIKKVDWIVQTKAIEEIK